MTRARGVALPARNRAVAATRPRGPTVTARPTAVGVPAPLRVPPGTASRSAASGSRVPSLDDVRARAGGFARRHLGLLLVLAVATLVRVANLFPLYYYGDDAEYAIVASYLAQDARNLAYPDLEGFGPRPFVSQPPLLLYLFAVVGAAVGSIEVGAVLVSVVLGAATTGVVYALGAVIHSRLAGTVGGLVLAFLPTHVNFSRHAFLDAGFAFFVTLTLLMVVVWTQRRTAPWAWATGAAAAATALSKLPGVLVLVPVAAAFALVGLRAVDAYRARQAPVTTRRLRRFVDHVVAMGTPLCAAAWAYLALLAYLGSTRDLVAKLQWQFGRVSGDPAVADVTVERPWHWYFTDAHWGLPAQAGLLVAVLAVVGLGVLARQVAIRRLPAPAALALVAWPVAILAFFTLSDRKEGFYLLPVLPAVALLAGVGGVWAFHRAATVVRSRFDAPAPRPVAAGLVGAVVLVAGLPAVSPAPETIEDVFFDDDISYGYGVKEAAEAIHRRDPEAGQVGTLLGRYTLHLYNGQPTYHWYVPHPFLASEIEAGRVRYVVIDTWLPLDHERAWMEGLVDAYDGRLVEDYRGVVKLYELSPGNVTR